MKDSLNILKKLFFMRSAWFMPSHQNHDTHLLFLLKETTEPSVETTSVLPSEPTPSEGSSGEYGM
jgi:hypothetical protein